MNELIIKTLTPFCKNVDYGWYDEDINDTHITFLEFLDKEDDFYDGVNDVETHYFQIDIWSLVNTIQLKKDVKRALKLAGFIYEDGAGQFEKETRIYHKSLRFYIKEEVESIQTLNVN